MSVYFAHEAGHKEETLARLTQDMRRLRYHHTFTVADSRVASLPLEEVCDSDREFSTFWSIFDLVPVQASSFWCNLTPRADEKVAKPLAFANPMDVVEVAERSLKRKPMPPRVGAGSIKWATHTLSGPEYTVKPEATFKYLPTQPFGFVFAFDTRVAPHVANVEDDRPDTIRVSLEGRKLVFIVDTSKWVTPTSESQNLANDS